MSFKLHIPDPCNESWEKMKIGIDSRFCENCKKDVIDFTGKSRQEILEIILSARGQKMCGRFHKSQLDYTTDDLLITIQGISQNPRNTNLAFYVLTVGTLLLSSCSNDDGKKTSVTKEIVDADQKIKADTMHSRFNKYELDTIACVGEEEKKKHSGEELEINFRTTGITLGMIAQPPPPETIPSFGGAYKLAEVMPEFQGGIEALNKYVVENLKFPSWELKHKIEGTVYVTFIVDKTGKTKEPKILKSVEGSKHFDEEVIKLINNMPLWKPGSHNQKNVDVEFNLPIKFKIL